MKAAAFSHLSLSNQSDLLWSDGELLAVRETDIFVIQLYSVYHFLVEVIFVSGSGRIETIKIMNPRDLLQDYTEMVSLPPDLFS